MPDAACVRGGRRGGTRYRDRCCSPLRRRGLAPTRRLSRPAPNLFEFWPTAIFLRFVDSNERSPKRSKLVQPRPRMEVRTRVDQLREDRIAVPQKVPRAVGSATAEAPLRARPAMIYPGRR